MGLTQSGHPGVEVVERWSCRNNIFVTVESVEGDSTRESNCELWHFGMLQLLALEGSMKMKK